MPVQKKDSYISLHLAQCLAELFEELLQKYEISPREAEVFKLLMDGNTNIKKDRMQKSYRINPTVDQVNVSGIFIYPA